jgi:hypothetical protein
MVQPDRGKCQDLARNYKGIAVARLGHICLSADPHKDVNMLEEEAEVSAIIRIIYSSKNYSKTILINEIK